MTELNEQEQLALRDILQSPVFEKAKQIVLEKSNGPVYNLLAPEQGMALAQEKGVRNAFRLLSELITPRTPIHQPTIRTLNRNK
jgi:hypothetical protein